MRYCDLHTHSYFSDGSCSPRELISEAEKIGLSHIALTDHNTTAGLSEFLAAAKDSAVRAIPGVELSCDFGADEVHILALCIEKENYSVIESAVAEMQKRKDESNSQLIASLKKGGIDIDEETILGRTSGHINRAHIAEAIVLGGYAKDIPDAFDKYLKPYGGYYVPPRRLDAIKTVRLIDSLGAVAVLAHPFLSLKTTERVEEFLTIAVPAGLDGMEVIYSTYDKETEREARRIALTFGLLQSGGSDYHGTRKPDISIGTGRGNLRIPDEFAEGIIARSQAKKSGKRK